MKNKLSPREHQLIKLASNGHTDAAIAHLLMISESTVGSYWVRIRAKLGPLSRPEIIAAMVREELQAVVNDLQEQNASLLKQVESTHDLGDRARNPQAFQTMIETALDGILLVTSEGTVKSINGVAATMFGYAMDEVKGQGHTLLVPDRYREQHQASMASYFLSPESRKMADHLGTLGLRKDGSEFPIAASLSPISTPDGTFVMCIVREVQAS